MATTALDIAKYIVAFAECKGDLITHKKLQKLLYYAQAWHLVYFDGNPLFEEHPQAWVHGPVYPSVYEKFSRFGSGAVNLTAEYQILGVECEEYTRQLAKRIGLATASERLIHAVLLKYGKLSAFQLELLSHEESPWAEQREGLGDFERGSREISFATMHDYYATLLPKAA